MDSNSAQALSSLVSGVTAIAMMLILVTGAVWLVAQIIKHRAARNMDPRNVALLEQMSLIAQRMDGRMAAVERILDAESPAWRQDVSGVGGKYEKQVG